MTPELTALALAGLLQAGQFVLVSVPANLELGSKKTLAPRDDGELKDMVAPRTARLARAMNNHFEGLILFTLAVVGLILGTFIFLLYNIPTTIAKLSSNSS